MNFEILSLWNMPYLEYLDILQEKKIELLKYPKKRYLIFCSHQHCFTHGKGLRSLKNSPELINFEERQKKDLPYPLYQINRGGGLTFHYPGQIIIYPIVNLNFFPKALMTLMHHLLVTMGEVLLKLKLIDEFDIPKEVYGLWSKNQKIASIGMGLDRYVTEHGLALNFWHDQEMFAQLEKIYPCGISPLTYSSVEKLQHKVSFEDRANVQNLFINSFVTKFS